GVARSEGSAADVVLIAVPGDGPDVRSRCGRSRRGQGGGEDAGRAAAQASRAAAASELLHVLIEEEGAHPAGPVAAVDGDLHRLARRVGGLVRAAPQADVACSGARVLTAEVAAIASGRARGAGAVA